MEFVREQDSRRIQRDEDRALKGYRHSKAIQSFIRKRILESVSPALQGSQPFPEIRYELYRRERSPWVRCILEVDINGMVYHATEFGKGPQQAIKSCVDHLKQRWNTIAGGKFHTTVSRATT